jgi:hypothetical protein
MNQLTGFISGRQFFIFVPYNFHYCLLPPKSCTYAAISGNFYKLFIP